MRRTYTGAKRKRTTTPAQKRQRAVAQRHSRLSSDASILKSGNSVASPKNNQSQVKEVIEPELVNNRFKTYWQYIIDFFNKVFGFFRSQVNRLQIANKPIDAQTGEPVEYEKIEGELYPDDYPIFVRKQDEINSPSELSGEAEAAAANSGQDEQQTAAANAHEKPARDDTGFTDSSSVEEEAVLISEEETSQSGEEQSSPENDGDEAPAISEVTDRLPNEGENSEDEGESVEGTEDADSSANGKSSDSENAEQEKSPASEEEIVEGQERTDESAEKPTWLESLEAKIPESEKDTSASSLSELFAGTQGETTAQALEDTAVLRNKTLEELLEDAAEDGDSVGDTFEDIFGTTSTEIDTEEGTHKKKGIRGWLRERKATKRQARREDVEHYVDTPRTSFFSKMFNPVNAAITEGRVEDEVVASAWTGIIAIFLKWIMIMAVFMKGIRLLITANAFGIARLSFSGSASLAFAIALFLFAGEIIIILVISSISFVSGKKIGFNKLASVSGNTAPNTILLCLIAYFLMDKFAFVSIGITIAAVMISLASIFAGAERLFPKKSAVISLVLVVLVVIITVALIYFVGFIGGSLADIFKLLTR